MGFYMDTIKIPLKKVFCWITTIELITILNKLMIALVAQLVKNLPAMQET